jgi:hypothetical protein
MEQMPAREGTEAFIDLSVKKVAPRRWAVQMGTGRAKSDIRIMNFESAERFFKAQTGNEA